MRPRSNPTHQQSALELQAYITTNRSQSQPSIICTIVDFQIRWTKEDFQKFNIPVVNFITFEVCAAAMELGLWKAQASQFNPGEEAWLILGLPEEMAITPSRVLIACIGIHFFQQCSGIDLVVLYSPRIFEKAGITSLSKKLLVIVAVGFVKTVSILVATFLLDKIWRRPLLLSSVTTMMVSLAALASGHMVIDHSDRKITWALALCIIMLLAFVASFSIGMGPITWVQL